MFTDPTIVILNRTGTRHLLAVFRESCFSPVHISLTLLRLLTISNTSSSKEYILLGGPHDEREEKRFDSAIS